MSVLDEIAAFSREVTIKGEKFPLRFVGTPAKVRLLKELNSLPPMPDPLVDTSEMSEEDAEEAVTAALAALPEEERQSRTLITLERDAATRMWMIHCMQAAFVEEKSEDEWDRILTASNISPDDWPGLSEAVNAAIAECGFPKSSDEAEAVGDALEDVEQAVGGHPTA